MKQPVINHIDENDKESDIKESDQTEMAVSQL